MSDLVGNPEVRFSHNDAHIILRDIKMQCEYVAFPCKEYISMHAKVQAPGQSLMRYIAERGVTLLVG